MLVRSLVGILYQLKMKFLELMQDQTIIFLLEQLTN